MPQYKLIYFDMRGRAEPIRMLFALQGQEFEDYRFKESDWPGKLKGNKELIPLGQVPVLLIDGKPMPHGRAICQHLAREFGLYGANNIEAAKTDVICEVVGDIFTGLIPINFEKDEEKKVKGLAEFKDSKSRPFLTYLSDGIKQAGGRFFVGSSETLADVMVFVLLDFLNRSLGDAFVGDNYPDLAKFHKGITENSKLTAYIKSRP